MGDPRTGTTISKKFLHCCEGLDPITDFSTWGSSKGSGNPQRICLSRSMDLDYRTATGLGKQRLFKGTNKSLVFTRTQGKWAVTQQQTEPELPVSIQECLAETWVDSGLLWGQEHWQQQSCEQQFWPSTENCIKDLPSMAPPIRTRPWFPHNQSLPSGSFHKPLILIHQREDRMKTTAQKAKQTDHMDHSLI